MGVKPCHSRVLAAERTVGSVVVQRSSTGKVHAIEARVRWPRILGETPAKRGSTNFARVELRTACLTATLLVLLPGRPAPASPPLKGMDRLEAATALHERGDDEGAARLLEQARAEDPKAFEPLWRQAYHRVVLANRIPDRKARAARIQSILPQVDSLLRWHGGQADAWFLLGRWHEGFATLNPVERTFVDLLLGGMPEGASLDSARLALERADRLRPDDLQILSDLVRVLELQGQSRRAREVAARSLAVRPRHDADRRMLEALRLVARRPTGG